LHCGEAAASGLTLSATSGLVSVLPGTSASVDGLGTEVASGLLQYSDIFSATTQEKIVSEIVLL